MVTFMTCSICCRVELADNCYRHKLYRLIGVSLLQMVLTSFVCWLQLNRAEFDGLSDEARIRFEGFRPGLYVRVQINGMPAEFIDNFEPTYPIVLGGLLSAEQNIGYVMVGILSGFPSCC